MAYRLENLAWDIRKALSLSPSEGLRRLSGRGVRYARRLRYRGRATRLRDDELLSSMIRPASSVAELVARRRESAALFPASLRSATTAAAVREAAPDSTGPVLAAARAVAAGKIGRAHV